MKQKTLIRFRIPSKKANDHNNLFEDKIANNQAWWISAGGSSFITLNAEVFTADRYELYLERLQSNTEIKGVFNEIIIHLLQ